MNFKLVSLTSVAGFFLFSAGQAVANLPQHYYDWKGAYIGLQGGYSQNIFTGQRSKTSILPKEDENKEEKSLITNLEPITKDRESLLGGLYIGFNIPIYENFLAGLEIDGNYNYIPEIDVAPTGKEGSSTENSDDKNPEKNKNFGDPSLITSQYGGDVRFRVGAALDNLMPYVAVGASFRRVERDLKDAKGESVDLKDKKTQSLFGWTIGGGIDVAVSKNLIFRFEFRHNNLRRFELEAKGKAVIEEKEEGKEATYTDNPNKEYVILKDLYHYSNELRVGVSYKF
ncbi:outer membrane protein [Bartonella sp. DGB1]|uniref:outer membrane protein n=1 Tax=Bartonella sp. DGB1 TaxID=3239807 RepID=UPI0035259162